MKANIGLSDDNRLHIKKILEQTLADENVLLVKTKKFHWNVVGINFNDFHGFFEGQYKELAEMVDETAERIRMIGFYSIGSMQDFLSLASIHENTEEKTSEQTMITELLGDHEIIINTMRHNIAKVNDELGDAGTADFLTGLIRLHEKMAWQLRSLVE